MPSAAFGSGLTGGSFRGIKVLTAGAALDDPARDQSCLAGAVGLEAHDVDRDLVVDQDPAGPGVLLYR